LPNKIGQALQQGSYNLEAENQSGRRTNSLSISINNGAGRNISWKGAFNTNQIFSFDKSYAN